MRVQSMLTDVDHVYQLKYYFLKQIQWVVKNFRARRPLAGACCVRAALVVCEKAGGNGWKWLPSGVHFDFSYYTVTQNRILSTGGCMSGASGRTRTHGRILVVDDDQDLLKMLELNFKRQGFQVQTAATGAQALALVDQEVFDLVLSDLMIDDLSGIDVLSHVKQGAPQTEVIIITGYSSVGSAVQAMQEGAYDYITKPVDLDELNIKIRKALQQQQLEAQVANLTDQVKKECLENIVARSPVMRNLLQMVRRVASREATILIEGESGTGKEVIARAVHHLSARAAGPFVAINCAALPVTLLESELFGHVKGAFTGAHATKKGLFEEAENGTIFLDEIAETDPSFQVKLLRVLQENEIRRVGDNSAIAINARVLAASNRPVQQLVEQGDFRQDLYYRLRVVPLYIPPLRDRREDIVPLAQHFIACYCQRHGIAAPRLHRDAVAKLEASPWPGNVRELENTIERALIMVEGDTLRAEDIIMDQPPATEAAYDFSHMTLKELECTHIRHMVHLCGGNQAEAARRLDIGYNTLWRKMKEYGVSR